MQQTAPTSPWYSPTHQSGWGTGVQPPSARRLGRGTARCAHYAPTRASRPITLSQLLSVCFCLCSLFYRDDVLCWLLLARPFLYAFHAHLRFPVDLVWFRLSCDHGWIRSGSVNVRKQQQQQQRALSPRATSAVTPDTPSATAPTRIHRQTTAAVPG